MTDYSKMSDFEINGLIAKRTQKVGDFTQARGLTFIHEYGNPVADFGALCLGWKEFDPCNNPSDAWPIIVGNRINIRFGAEGMACEAQFIQYGYESVEHYHTNPLRAAMIVFLMMQEKRE